MRAYRSDATCNFLYKSRRIITRAGHDPVVMVALDDYVWWQTQDRKVLKRINVLIQDVQRNGNEGIGKPGC